MLHAHFQADQQPVVKESVPVLMGRSLEVPQAAGGACLFDFADLCGKPVAAADYIALCKR